MLVQLIRETPRGWSPDGNHFTEVVTDIEKSSRNFPNEKLPDLYAAAGKIEGMFAMFTGISCRGSLALTISGESQRLRGGCILAYSAYDAQKAIRLVAEIQKEAAAVMEKFRGDAFLLKYEFRANVALQHNGSRF